MTGPLPFPYTADLVAQGGAVQVAGIRLAVWPSGRGSSSRGGQHYTHDGECPGRYNEDLQEANLRLLVADGPFAGQSFTVVEAELNEQLIPHVALHLNRTRN